MCKYYQAHSSGGDRSDRAAGDDDPCTILIKLISEHMPGVPVEAADGRCADCQMRRMGVGVLVTDTYIWAVSDDPRVRCAILAGVRAAIREANIDICRDGDAESPCVWLDYEWFEDYDGWDDDEDDDQDDDEDDDWDDDWDDD